MEQTFGGTAERDGPRPVLILGAGINGAAVAREFLLNRVPVHIVDMGDLAGGTTAYSSRLIHGGLRYLEHGEFSLVRESLAERRRLLKSAPHLVRPLRFHIPVRQRLGGWSQAAARLIGWPPASRGSTRGLWLVRAGLTMYDWIARADDLPGPATRRVDAASRPPLDPDRFRWTCSYSDAQIVYPERFVMALLEDARRLADDGKTRLEVLPYHRATLRGATARIERSGQPVLEFEPAAIINATGAWVDRTLRRLAIDAEPLIGGTKGSHLLVDHRGFADSLGGDAIYLEAPDGRPVFLLPLRGKTLIGTTDLPFAGDPGSAVADDEEIDYLIAAANEVFPATKLTRADVVMHYSGVRPLPRADPARGTSSITRRHFIREHSGVVPPTYSLIGGKLTTCRALAESTCQTVMRRLGLARVASSRARLLPGAENHPSTPSGLAKEQSRVALATGATPEQVDAVWSLLGSRAAFALGESREELESIVGTDLPAGFVRRVIRTEWVQRLGDLVERRLMLLYDRRLGEPTLRELARLLCEENKLRPADLDAEVAAYGERLGSRFGKTLTR